MATVVVDQRVTGDVFAVRTTEENFPVALRVLPVRCRVAVTGYLAGALDTADAIERCGGEVCSGVLRPRRVDMIRHAAGLLLQNRRIRA